VSESSWNRSQNQHGGMKVWSGMHNFAEIALKRMQAIVATLPDVERSDNPPGCYFLIRRKIFAQIATVIDHSGRPVTMVALRPDPDERDALLANGHPYFSRGPWDDRLGRIAVLIEATTDWDEITELVTDSYRLTAPKKLIAQLDAGDRPPGLPGGTSTSRP
jgi:predicted DNA-binding protein (MmcQ/YjbR family)